MLATTFGLGALLTGQLWETAFARPTPAASECTIDPRTPSEIITLVERSDIATPPATTGGATLPSGIPVSPADGSEIEATINAWLACQNAGEPLRAWSFFTDGYLYRLLSREAGLSEASLTNMATPTPSTSQPALVDVITDLRQLPDGRLGASVTILYASIPMPKRFFFYFVRTDNGLRIDSILGEISFSVP